MERRKFLAKSLAAGAIIPAAYAAFTPSAAYAEESAPEGLHNYLYQAANPEIVIERSVPGKPHAGKVLAVIQPHNDDIPLFAAGTVAKLIDEGYTAYLIRTSNDDAAGGGTNGERILNNEIDNNEVAKVLGIKKVYDLGYRNHRMDEYNIQEIKGRLIFLFRLLKVDTVVSYDPWGHYEENPDHYVTARAVEAARWMASSPEDYPEQLDVVKPHAVMERYYFARGPQLVNRVVDITKYVDLKIKSNIVCKTQGPGGHNGAALRKRLAAEGRKLELLGDNDDTANYNYIKEFIMDRNRIVGEKYGLEYAEQFHYIGRSVPKVANYIKKNAVKI
jgi:LmbE family N-acetylglucosaminyl deacetylase